MLRLVLAVTLLRYFNSIKVRLEPLEDEYVTAASSFQFHKGTIRTPKHDDYKSIFIGFQFHKGTIRTIGSAIGAGANLLFQFHKGTIRTRRKSRKYLKKVISIP